MGVAIDEVVVVVPRNGNAGLGDDDCTDGYINQTATGP